MFGWNRQVNLHTHYSSWVSIPFNHQSPGGQLMRLLMLLCGLQKQDLIYVQHSIKTPSVGLLSMVFGSLLTDLIYESIRPCAHAPASTHPPRPSPWSCQPYSWSWISGLPCILWIISTDQALSFRSAALLQDDKLYQGIGKLKGQGCQSTRNAI